MRKPDRPLGSRWPQIGVGLVGPTSPNICILMVSFKSLVGAICLLFLVSCSAGVTEEASAAPPSAEPGILSLIVTDAPLDHALVVEALIRINKVRIHT